MNTLAICFTLISLGFSGFILTVFSTQALLCLGLIAAGFSGLIGVAIAALDKHGLIIFFPEFMQNILLNETLLQVIVDKKLLKIYQDKMAEILPIFLARTDNERLEALNNMSLENRKKFTTKGVVNTFAPWKRRLILSKEQLEQQASRGLVYSPSLAPMPTNITTPSSQTVAVINSTGSEAKELDLAMQLVQEKEKHFELAASTTKPKLIEQRELAQRLIRNMFSNANVEFILRVINPEVCKVSSLVGAIMVMLQLLWSQRSRQVFSRLLRGLFLVCPAIGTCVGIALVLIHKQATQIDRVLNKDLKYSTDTTVTSRS